MQFTAKSWTGPSPQQDPANFQAINYKHDVYSPGIDQPVCMLENPTSDGIETYYYHFEGLGSVVALSDSSGDTVQTYQYTVFGEVWAEDNNQPNPYMFASRGRCPCASAARRSRKRRRTPGACHRVRPAHLPASGTARLECCSRVCPVLPVRSWYCLLAYRLCVMARDRITRPVEHKNLQTK